MRIGRWSVINGNRAMRRVINDGLISLAAVVVLLVMLVSIDPRVRDTLRQMIAPPTGASGITGVGTKLGDISMVMLKAAHDHSVENAPLVIFSVAATILVLFMLRT